MIWDCQKSADLVVSHQVCFRVLIINLWFEVFRKLFKNEISSNWSETDSNAFRMNWKFKIRVIGSEWKRLDYRCVPLDQEERGPAGSERSSSGCEESWHWKSCQEGGVRKCSNIGSNIGSTFSWSFRDLSHLPEDFCNGLTVWTSGSSPSSAAAGRRAQRPCRKCSWWSEMFLWELSERSANWQSPEDVGWVILTLWGFSSQSWSPP